MPQKTKDTSPKIHQKKKIKKDFELSELDWTEKQKRFIEIASDRNTQVMMVKGAAGTSKTLMAMFCGLRFLKEKKVSDIMMVRSIVESSDNKIGFLPGPAQEKSEPYMMPFFDKIGMMVNQSDIKWLQADGHIEASPISFLRGLDWNVKCVILDEGQNLNKKELLTFMSRIGRFCKVFICGDEEQSDIKNSGFAQVFGLFNNPESAEQGIQCFEFGEEDIMRSKLCRFVVHKFKEIMPNYSNGNSINGEETRKKEKRAEQNMEWFPMKIE